MVERQSRGTPGEKLKKEGKYLRPKIRWEKRNSPLRNESRLLKRRNYEERGGVRGGLRQETELLGDEEGVGAPMVGRERGRREIWTGKKGKNQLGTKLTAVKAEQLKSDVSRKRVPAGGERNSRGVPAQGESRSIMAAMPPEKTRKNRKRNGRTDDSSLRASNKEAYKRGDRTL